MLKVFAVLLFSVMFSGCATVEFYNNGPVNGVAVKDSVTIEEVDVENSYFDIYKLNSSMRAIGYSKNPIQSFIRKINRTIILTEEQVNDLREVCREIIDIDSQSVRGETKIVDYYVVLNNKEVVNVSDSMYLSSLGIGSSTSYTNAFHRIVFRLQYARQPVSVFDSFFDIDNQVKFVFGKHLGEMSVEDVRKLLRDLEK